jgi:hypothetical protein
MGYLPTMAREDRNPRLRLDYTSAGTYKTLNKLDDLLGVKDQTLLGIARISWQSDSHKRSATKQSIPMLKPDR